MGRRLGCLTTQLVRGGTFLLLALAMLAQGSGANAQGKVHRAGLIVRFGDNSLVTRCVTFTEQNITGLEVLTRAGLSIVVDAGSSIGAGVCKIGRDGCDRGKSCFCQCEGSTCAYWQYFHLANGAWKYSNLGAGLYQVNDGAVEGWAWGKNAAPPIMSLDQLCAAGAAAPAQVAPTATALATASTTATRPAATLTPIPTTTPQATAPMVAPTNIASPTLAMILSATPTPTEMPVPTAEPSSLGTPPGASVISYVAFGAIVLGLGAWLVIQSRRASRG